MNERVLRNFVLILTMTISGLAKIVSKEAERGLLAGEATSNETESDCILSMQMECSVIGDGMSEAEACESFAIPMLTLESCKQTPITTTMLYNGGNCSQSGVDDAVLFSCQDGPQSSPPMEEGEESYIVVSDAQGKGIVYHEGWVQVGAEYVLAAPDGSTMQYGFHIQIYDDQDDGNLLQDVVYSSSLCSSDQEMLKLFGASQIISYINENQGNVSPFASYSYQTSLHVSISAMESGGTVSLHQFSLLTSFSGYSTLDRLVKGDQLVSGGTLTVTVPIDIDFTANRMNSVLAQVVAVQKDGSKGTCEGTLFQKFHTGGLKVGRS